MEIEVLLSCGHIMILTIESVLNIPQKGTEVRCSQCKQMGKIKRVGTPYRVKYYEEKTDDNNKK